MVCPVCGLTQRPTVPGPMIEMEKDRGGGTMPSSAMCPPFGVQSCYCDSHGAARAYAELRVSVPVAIAQGRLCCGQQSTENEKGVLRGCHPWWITMPHVLIAFTDRRVVRTHSMCPARFHPQFHRVSQKSLGVPKDQRLL